MFRWINNLFVFLATSTILDRVLVIGRQILHNHRYGLYGCGAKILKGVGGLFLSYGVLNDAFTNPDLVQEWFFTTTLVASKGLIIYS